jgi:hypothetical protein
MINGSDDSILGLELELALALAAQVAEIAFKGHH